MPRSTSTRTPSSSATVISFAQAKAARAVGRGPTGSPLPRGCEEEFHLPRHRVRAAAEWGQLTGHPLLKHLTGQEETLTASQIAAMDSVGYLNMLKELDDEFLSFFARAEV